MSGRPGSGARDPGSGRTEPDIVIAGSACRDIAADDPRGWRLGGGVTYTALTCARLGLRTAAVIGLDPEALDAHELSLLAGAGVELLRVRLARAPIYLNIDSPAGRIQTCVEPGLPLPHVAVPAAWREARAWILAPVAGELDDDWADPIPTDAFVALGWQGLLRNLRAGERVTRRAPAPGRLVWRADLIGISEHDVEPGTPLEDLARLLHAGAWLAYTNGVAGGRLAEVTAAGVDRIVPYRAITAAREVDATGAGDTFLAGLVASVVRANLDAVRDATGSQAAGDDAAGDHATGARAARDRAAPNRAAEAPDRADRAATGPVDPARESRFAAAAASFTVEAPGLDGVPDLAAVVGRLAGQAGQSAAAPPSSST